MTWTFYRDTEGGWWNDPDLERRTSIGLGIEVVYQGQYMKNLVVELMLDDT